MSLNIAKHKNILIKILKSIFSDTTIGPLLGFKGGTAAMLFYGLDRFSVDLDFDLLDETKENYVFERVQEIIKKYGIVKKAEIKRFNLLFILSYYQKEEDAQNVKIEINRRNFGSKYDVKSYLGIPMKVMTREYMAPHKLVAMFERIGRTNRDIFDVYFFFEHNWPINKQIVENRMEMPYKKFLEKCIKTLSKIDNKNILAGMGELLTEKQKIWVKTKLKTETLFLLKLALENEK